MSAAVMEDPADPVEEVMSTLGLVRVAGAERPTDHDPAGMIRKTLGGIRSTRIVYEIGVSYFELDGSARDVSLRIGSTTNPLKRADQWAHGLSGALRDRDAYAPLWRVLADHVSKADLLVVSAWQQKPWRPGVGGVDALREAERAAHAVRSIERGSAPVCTGLAGAWRDGEHDSMAEALRKAA